MAGRRDIVTKTASSAQSSPPPGSKQSRHGHRRTSQRKQSTGKGRPKEVGQERGQREREDEKRLHFPQSMKTLVKERLSAQATCENGTSPTNNGRPRNSAWLRSFQCGIVTHAPLPRKRPSRTREEVQDPLLAAGCLSRGQ